MAQQQAKTVAGLRGQNQAARRSEIKRAGVGRKLADDGGEGAALERFGEGPERVFDVADTQMDEMRGADAELAEARRIRRAAFPGGEVVLDIKDVAARLAGAGCNGEGKAGGSTQVARGGRHNLMHRLAVQAAAEHGVGGRNAEGYGRPRRLAAVTDAAMLDGGDGLPQRAQIFRRQWIWHGSPP